eukprot:GHRQ01002757.1.p2 GENE.GHRQ01002757.1~~GHRQ01002757.1.p2  ORF type:complete len:255 (+),score=81.46 GHRQ01002757.1:912-1676(+)
MGQRTLPSATLSISLAGASLHSVTPCTPVHAPAPPDHRMQWGCRGCGIDFPLLAVCTCVCVCACCLALCHLAVLCSALGAAAGADEVAVETCSFSKYAGFTGVRLGWTVVPKKLRYADGSSVHADWNRVMTTCFNGASNIVQAGGLACLQPEGLKEMYGLINFYKENATILKKTFQEMGFEVFGGEDAPYVWVGFPGKPSWDVFAEILEKCNIVTTPGSGFGPAGEGFVRASAFGSRDNIMEAVRRFKEVYGKQ